MNSLHYLVLRGNYTGLSYTIYQVRTTQFLCLLTGIWIWNMYRRVTWWDNIYIAEKFWSLPWFSLHHSGISLYQFNMYVFVLSVKKVVTFSGNLITRLNYLWFLRLFLQYVKKVFWKHGKVWIFSVDAKPQIIIKFLVFELLYEVPWQKNLNCKEKRHNCLRF